MNLEFSRQIFLKILKYIFHKPPSSGSHVVPCEWTDKLIVAFLNFTNVPKIVLQLSQHNASVVVTVRKLIECCFIDARVLRYNTVIRCLFSHRQFHYTLFFVLYVNIQRAG
jgi:hypothetical protein